MRAALLQSAVPASGAAIVAVEGGLARPFKVLQIILGPREYSGVQLPAKFATEASLWRSHIRSHLLFCTL